jgi:hypothetical protein
MLDEDDDRLRAYIESQKQMGNEEELMVDIIENAEVPEDQLSAIREIAEEGGTEGLPSIQTGEKSIADEIDDMVKSDSTKKHRPSKS